MQAHKSAFGANFIAADDTEVDIDDYLNDIPTAQQKIPILQSWCIVCEVIGEV